MQSLAKRIEYVFLIMARKLRRIRRVNPLAASRAETNRQAALFRLSADLAETLDDEEIHQRLVSGLHATLGYEIIAIFSVEKGTSIRHLSAFAGYKDPQSQLPEGKGIYFSFPAVHYGMAVNDVRLEFKAGKVVSATSSNMEKELNKILDTDEGSRTIGELGIGNNFAIQKFTSNILFDKKIGGTVHLALGDGYTKTLSKNESAIHWDMVKDLRRDGELYFDDKLVQKDGTWLIDLK